MQIEKRYYIKGMSCNACELRLEKKLLSIAGVNAVKASYSEDNLIVDYDEKIAEGKAIENAITELGYQCYSEEELREIKNQNRTFDKDSKGKWLKIAIILIIIIGAFIILNYFGLPTVFNKFPEAEKGMSLITVFVIGLFTSIHCIGMCGGICLSQCIAPAESEGKKIKKLRPSFLYNLGRIISYTLIGGAIGLLGSVFSVTGVMRGAIAIFAGGFMVILGLNMLGVFPWLKKLNIHMPKFLIRNLDGKNNSPFYIGLINGFMPCGPLQAMQLYALSTASPLLGATAMFLFGLGTSPLMFSFGALGSLITKNKSAIIMTISASLVIVLGLTMFNTGLSMSGFKGFDLSNNNKTDFTPKISGEYQLVKIEVQPNKYGPITVKKDLPVKFNLHVEEKNLNGCNNKILIPEYGIEKELQVGDNIVEFTPKEVGEVPYSCWMNMIRSKITVLE
ncbi:MAG: sulfite exporter TauE/SafE family protein [Anaerovoracaceae bacterium]